MRGSDAERKSIILLDEETCGDVFVIPSNKDKFILTMKDAVRACRAGEDQIRFLDQFKELIEHRLAQWIEENKAHLKAATLLIRESDILFIATQKESQHDEQLSQSLSELDIEVANDEAFNLICLNVLSIPPVTKEAANAFLCSGQILRYAK